jgi:hypothetical protein
MLIPLIKVDQASRIVHGRIDETTDRAGEIFDYASSKPHFEKWSADLAKASDGKSLGNVRVMHQLKAAGVLTGDDQRTLQSPHLTQPLRPQGRRGASSIGQTTPRTPHGA